MSGIKELKVELNTAQSMRAEQVVEINGVLKGIILDNQEPLDVLMTSELGYVLYQEGQRQGTHYFPLKVTALNYKSKQFNFVADNYYLNEKIIVLIKGPQNAKLNIVFRYT